jgi:hypothetical protein
MQDRILPTNDLAFKKILASESAKDISCGFIRDFWGFEALEEDLSITNPYNIQAYTEIIKETGLDIIKLRQTILDVSFSVRMRDMQVELQVEKETYFTERSVYYAFSKYCTNYNKEGFMEVAGADAEGKGGKPDRYSSLRPVYSLNVLNYTHFNEDKDALHIFTLYDEKHKRALEKELISIGYFELTKEKFDNENQAYWREFIISGKAGAGAPGYIKKAEGLIEYINMGDKEKAMFNALEKAQADFDAYYVTAWNTGKKEGWEGGKQEERQEVIAMMNKASSFDDFKRMMGLQ